MDSSVSLYVDSFIVCLSQWCSQLTYWYFSRVSRDNRDNERVIGSLFVPVQNDYPYLDSLQQRLHALLHILNTRWFWRYMLECCHELWQGQHFYRFSHKMAYFLHQTQTLYWRYMSPNNINNNDYIYIYIYIYIITMHDLECNIIEHFNTTSNNVLLLVDAWKYAHVNST